MIIYNNKKLERVLFNAFKKEYPYLEGHYLVLESIEFNLDDEAINYYTIRGRYGVEDKWQKQFDLFLDVSWSYDFIAGFFCMMMQLEEDK